MEILNSSQQQGFVPHELELLASHLQTQNKAPNDVASLKQGIKKKLLALTEQVESCINKKALQQLAKQINAAQNLFSSLQKHTCHHYKMQPMSNTPANKNIEKQKGFRPIKKEPKRPANPDSHSQPMKISFHSFQKPMMVCNQSLCLDGLHKHCAYGNG